MRDCLKGWDVGSTVLCCRALPGEVVDRAERNGREAEFVDGDFLVVVGGTNQNSENS